MGINEAYEEQEKKQMTYEEAIKYIGNHYMAYVPFLQENREQINKHNKVMDIAIECIEKQIPKKVRKYKANPNLIYFECPCCDHKNQADIKFCRYCGQAIDWSEVE